MNITVTIKGLALGNQWNDDLEVVEAHLMGAEPEESLVSIVDRIDTELSDFRVMSITMDDEV